MRGINLGAESLAYGGFMQANLSRVGGQAGGNEAPVHQSNFRINYPWYGPEAAAMKGIGAHQGATVRLPGPDPPPPETHCR